MTEVVTVSEKRTRFPFSFFLFKEALWAFKILNILWNSIRIWLTWNLKNNFKKTCISKGWASRFVLKGKVLGIQFLNWDLLIIVVILLVMIMHFYSAISYTLRYQSMVLQIRLKAIGKTNGSANLALCLLCSSFQTDYDAVIGCDKLHSCTQNRPQRCQGIYVILVLYYLFVVAILLLFGP